MVQLLDEVVPIVLGSELNDDPLQPLSIYAIDIIQQKGDDTPIDWWHRENRYVEKLATPDVSIADLVGDVDPIKAATLKLPYSDERVIHYGLIPRSHRGIFVINELPDLQARIQVSLFNILQEGDIQIRGFKMRLPLDIQFIFTANPEDYTNRGSIVTPLKDRIDSQIITHYPKNIEIGRKITAQEAKILPTQKAKVILNDVVKDMIEQVAIEARKSEYVDSKSGVSARLTIAAYEILYSTAERRSLINNENQTHIRIADLWGIVPAITGKIELVYEGEQEGALIVAHNLIAKTIKSTFLDYFPNPAQFQKQKNSPYKLIVDWFNKGQKIDILQDFTENEYRKSLHEIEGLADFVYQYQEGQPFEMQLFLMELVLHGLAEHSLLSRNILSNGLTFKDLLSSFNLPDDFEFDEDE
jgi:magnesium chelatase subunit I